MKYTNYYDLKLNLHKQMVNEIRKLMEECDIKVINFDNYPSDVIGVPEIITSDLVILTVKKIILEEDDTPDDEVWTSEIAVDRPSYILVGSFGSYKEAVEAALKYCLENLI